MLSKVRFAGMESATRAKSNFRNQSPIGRLAPQSVGRASDFPPPKHWWLRQLWAQLTSSAAYFVTKHQWIQLIPDAQNWHVSKACGGSNFSGNFPWAFKAMNGRGRSPSTLQHNSAVVCRRSLGMTGNTRLLLLINSFPFAVKDSWSRRLSCGRGESVRLDIVG
jgi:hypothetical protein